MEIATDAGPPEADDGNPQDQGERLYSRGFVPNLQDGLTELEHLQHAAANIGPYVLTIPEIRGTPISEYSGHQIAIDAFPTLFPSGKADYNAPREIKVTMEEWAGHLLCLEGKQFSQHPRFRYWVLNTIMRHAAKKASSWYLNTHHDDRRLTVEDI